MPHDVLHECELGYRGLTVAVRGGDAAAAPLQWLHEFLAPWLDDQDRDEARIALDVVIDPRRYAAAIPAVVSRGAAARRDIDCFTMDGGFERHALVRDAAEVRIIHHAAGEFVLAIHSSSRTMTLTARADHARFRVGFMRVVRELAMMQALSRGDLPLHAAGVVLSTFTSGGAAVLFAGAKRAGKTTMLLDALRLAGAKFLSNDRVMVASITGEAVARGMPTIISVRPQSLGHVPSLTPPAWPYPYRHYLSVRECVEGSELLEPAQRDPTGMSAAQFCRWLAIGAVADAPLAAIIFPVIDATVDGFALERLSAAAVAARLSQSLLGQARAPEAFAALFGGPWPHAEEIAASARRLAGQCAGYRCRVGPRAYESPGLHDAIASTVA